MLRLRIRQVISLVSLVCRLFLLFFLFICGFSTFTAPFCSVSVGVAITCSKVAKWISLCRFASVSLTVVRLMASTRFVCLPCFCFSLSFYLSFFYLFYSYFSHWHTRTHTHSLHTCVLPNQAALINSPLTRTVRAH